MPSWPRCWPLGVIVVPLFFYMFLTAVYTCVDIRVDAKIRRKEGEKRFHPEISSVQLVQKSVIDRLPVCRAALDLGTRFDTRNTLFSIFFKESLRLIFFYTKKNSQIASWPTSGEYGGLLTGLSGNKYENGYLHERKWILHEI